MNIYMSYVTAQYISKFNNKLEVAKKNIVFAIPISNLLKNRKRD
jgi:hypothetical protein